uniref:Odorant receptor n=1 Tax=Apolygus lucorum TaxID=248454 RepID=A0A1Q1NII5_APOLU|nr:olfactory receptor [Apolygus lucorum]
MLFGAGSKELGFRKETIEEEDVGFMQLAGLYPLTRGYTAYYFISFILCTTLMEGMIVGSYLEGEVDTSLETAHVLLISLNMFTQICTHRYYYDIVNKLLRAIDDNFFSYGDTMDEDTKQVIRKLAKEKTARKKMFGKVFKIQVSSAAIAITFQRPILYVLNGRGVKDVDGENWLIYQSPFGILVPFSNYWVPYLFGMVLVVNQVITTSITAMATATSFVRFSEELLHQLEIVKLGLGNFMFRARHLHSLRYNQSKESGEQDKHLDKCIITCLSKSVEHHAIIIKLFGDFKNMMYIPLFTVIFDGSVLICMSAVQLITSKNPIVRMSMPPFIVAELYYTYLYCSYAEKLTNMVLRTAYSLLNFLATRK